MTEREILLKLRLLKAKRKKILELKQQIAEAATYIRGTSWTSTRVIGGAFITPQERYLERTELLKKELNRVFAEYEDLHYNLLELMTPLSAFDWTVILNRFFRGMTMQRTAQDMELSVERIKDIQAQAIKVMSEQSE